MKNSLIVALRREHDSLLLVAEGLLDMIYSHDACNVLTFSRMAAEAREAARRMASEIERILFEQTPVPKKSKVRDAVIGFFGKIAFAISNALAAA